jgi:type IV secretory pathway TrbF-like protein
MATQVNGEVRTSAPVTRDEERQILNSHYRPEVLGVLQRQVRSANRRAGLCCGLAVIGFFAALYFASQPKLVPYPIVFEPDGRIIWHGQAETTREERFIDVGLLEWIHHMRAVPKDEVVLHEYRETVGAMVYGKAAEKFKRYNRETIAAFKDSQRRVLVKVDRQNMTVTRKGPTQVSIGWSETWTPEHGHTAASETHRFEATLDYAWYAKPAGFSAAQARLNPRRLYVIDYTWDEVRQEGR